MSIFTNHESRATSHEERITNHAGMTLIELVIVITIFAILGAIFSQFLVEAYRGAASSNDLATVDWQARITLERLKRDLREARSATSADLTMSPSSQITFTDVSGNAITYARSGNTLTRQVGAGSAQALAENVTGLTFSYRDLNSAVTATVGDVRLITADITMTLRDVTRTYRFTVYPRNYPR